MVPRHLVPHNWSPIDWSLWTNGPQPIQSPWTNGPQKFGPHGQMVPNQFGPHGQMVPRIFLSSRGTGCGDPEIRGPNWLGTTCPVGPNSWGPFVQGDQILGDHLSRGTKFVGDCLTRGTIWVGGHLSMGTKFLGTIRPWGQKVGDQKSGEPCSGLFRFQFFFCVFHVVPSVVPDVEAFVF